MFGKYRKYSERKDRKAIHRIWQECGWIGDEKKETAALDRFLKVSSAIVYELAGQAEAVSVSTPARFRHTRTDLPLAAITGVTTSRVARNQGAASGTLVRLIAQEAVGGAALSGLGMFEQGFYDRLGFGNGNYELFMRFDPAWLKDFGKPPAPVRLGPEDWKAIHEARLGRRKLHGATDLLPAEVSQCELEWTKNAFGLGYREDGKLTHFFVGRTDDVEVGPYAIEWMVYHSFDQLRDLLGLIRGLGDQVRWVRIKEPRDVQIQSLLRKPFQLQTLTRGSRHESRTMAEAYWQLRMLDVPRCIAAVCTDAEVAFNLTLSDPITPRLPEDAPWHGCGGEYTVRFGPTSTAEPVATGGLPTLAASVNDFTRFWMGAASAEVLAGLGTFRAPPDLIATLDRTLRLPPPAPDWDY
jgi:hypothetical protein